MPTPGPDTVRYGGNTSCVEVRSSDGTVVVLDCGTGARSLGQALARESAARGTPLTGAILIGHTHWDHIHGLPFFAPLFVPGGRWSLYGPRGLGQSLLDTLAGQMQYAYFPVSLEQLQAEVSYHDLVEGTFEIGDITVRTHYLNHPALTLGYRIEVDGSTVVYAADHEPYDRALATGGDLLASPQDARHVAFLQGADVVIHDAQYLAEEYEQKAGWGHSTVEYAVDACRLAGVGRLVLHHHDPLRTDAELDGLVAAANERAAGGAGIDAELRPLVVEAATEGAVLDLGVRAAGLPDGEPARASSAVQTPALGDLAAGVVLSVDDPLVAPVVRAAVDAERLQLVDTAHPDAQAAGVAVVDGDRDDGRPGVRELAASILGITRRSPRPSPAVDDWIVWPCTVAHIRTKLRAALLRRACRWQAAPVPPDEERRLRALRELQLLDTPAEERFDRYIEQACTELSVPIALVTLVDADRQWFKARRGISQQETPRDESLCAHAILQDDIFQVPDLLADERFAESPALTGADRIRFYAGVPLVAGDGSKVGTFCVADHRPRLFDDQQLAVLSRFAAEVEAELARTPARSSSENGQNRSPEPHPLSPRT